MEQSRKGVWDVPLRLSDLGLPMRTDPTSRHWYSLERHSALTKWLVGDPSWARQAANSTDLLNGWAWIAPKSSWGTLSVAALPRTGWWELRGNMVLLPIVSNIADTYSDRAKKVARTLRWASQQRE